MQTRLICAYLCTRPPGANKTAFKNHPQVPAREPAARTAIPGTPSPATCPAHQQNHRYQSRAGFRHFHFWILFELLVSGFGFGIVSTSQQERIAPLMTYCLGIVTKSGLVMASDSRTNAGTDQVSVCRKMFTFE